jgi:translation elongation factor EF-Ts
MTMVVTLEKIDLVRERTGVSYSEANDLLEKHDGDVVKAIMEVEESMDSERSGFTSKGDEILKKIKELIQEGNVTKITVKKDGDVIMNIPVNAGAIGVIISPFLGAVGLTAALVSKCSIEVTKSDGEVITVSEMAEKTAQKVKDTMKR